MANAFSVSSDMRDPGAYRTWTQQRACRLPSGIYQGYAVHIVVASHDRRPIFTRSPLSSEVFALVAADRHSLGACLMPDHLHWLLQIRDDLSARVARFKSLSTRIAWRHGRTGKLWQRTFYDRVLRTPGDLQEAVRYILGNPVEEGLVERAEDYPYQVCPIIEPQRPPPIA